MVEAQAHAAELAHTHEARWLQSAAMIWCNMIWYNPLSWYDAIWYYTIFCTLYSILYIVNCTILYRVDHVSPILYNQFIHHISMLLYYTILDYTILYYTMLYYTILYYTTLCYTILYHNILYCTILYYVIFHTISIILCDMPCHVTCSTRRRVTFSEQRFAVLHLPMAWLPQSASHERDGAWDFRPRLMREMGWVGFPRLMRERDIVYTCVYI